MNQKLKIAGVFLVIIAIVFLFFSASFSNEGSREKELRQERENYFLKQSELCSKYNTTPEKIDDFLEGFNVAMQRASLTGVSQYELQALLICTIRNTGCYGGAACQNFSAACKALCLWEYRDDFCEVLEKSYGLKFKNSDGKRKNFSEILAMMFVKMQTMSDKDKNQLVNSIVGGIYKDLFLGMMSGYPEAQKTVIDSQLSGGRNLVADFISARNAYSEYKESELHGLVNQRLNNHKWCVLTGQMFGIIAATAFILSVVLKNTRN